ncbi:MAG: glycosyltransferase family 1 protein [Chloroflexota bacterium]
MRVFINGRFLTQQTTGVQRVACEIVRQFDSMLDNGKINKNQHELILCSPKQIMHELNLQHIPVKSLGKQKGHLWEQTTLPISTSGSFLVNFCNMAPLIKRRTVVTIGDASVYAIPQTYSPSFRYWYQWMIRLLGRTAIRILTYSEFSRRELIRYANIPPSKIDVIPLGGDHFISMLSDPEIWNQYNIGDKPYILAVSSMNAQKNFRRIVDALSLLDQRLCDVIIIGGSNPGVFSKIKIDFPKNVRWIGYVSDAVLKALYQKAVCLVYPSLYEGFGLPPLEAMDCGCPVIVSNTASLPEVCGDAALYCDPHDPANIAHQISLLLEDSTLQDALRSKGLKHAAQFTWAKTAEKTWQVIESLL